MRKKKHVAEHENLERWLVSYADFITLLFAFFTVMYAISQQDKAKYQKAVENIQRSFLSAGGIFPLKGSPFTPFERPPGKGSALPVTANEIGAYSKRNVTSERVAEQIRGIFEKATGNGLPTDQVEVIQNEQGFKIRLGELLLFKPGSAKIKKDVLGFLYELSQRLERLEVPIQVEGHADKASDVTKNSLWELSVDRAFTIVQFFVEGTNFPPPRISLAGYGDTQPIAGNDTKEGRAKNRRIEIAVISPDKEITELPY